MPESGRYRGDRPDLLQIIRDLQKRVSTLERTPQLTAASIGKGGLRAIGGSIVIRDEANTTDLAVFSSDGIFIGGVDIQLPGTVQWFAGPPANLPAGWLVCDGAAVSRTTHADLFAAIGVTWGAGNGSTTFNLPNLIDRAPVGAGGLFPLGSTGGSDTHTHTTDSQGGHTHTNSDTQNTGAHTHTNSDTQNTGGHSHPINQGTDVGSFSVGGGVFATVSGDTHTHGGTSAAGGHQHTIPSTGSGGGHQHTIPATGSGGGHTHTAASTSSMAPYGAMTPIIRT